MLANSRLEFPLATHSECKAVPVKPIRGEEHISKMFYMVKLEKAIPILKAHNRPEAALYLQGMLTQGKIYLQFNPKSCEPVQ